MLRTFLNAFRVADIRKKLLFTAGMLALYRVGAYIPAPGIDLNAVQTLKDSKASLILADKSNVALDANALLQVKMPAPERFCS